MATRAVIPRHGSFNFWRLNHCITAEVDVLLDELTPFIARTELTLSKARFMRFCHEIFANFLCSKRFATPVNDKLDVVGDEEKKTSATKVNYDEIVGHYDYIFYDINQCYSTDFLPLLGTAGLNRNYLKDLAHRCQTVRYTHI